jgi:hypothetical protein
MANEMTSFINIKNGDSKVAEKLKEIFTPKEGEYNARTIELVNRLWGTDYTWDVNLSREENEEAENTWPEMDWMQENVGSKWIYSEYDHDDDPEFCHLLIMAAWSVPQGFLDKLAQELRKIKDDCYICGTYEDESYDPMGAFLYGGLWNDIEDYDDEIDSDKMWDDDEYRERIHDEVNQMRDDIENVYRTDIVSQ